MAPVFCLLTEFFRGSFTGVGKDQALLGLDACGEDYMNAGSPGSIVLAERDASGWHVLDVERGRNLRGCKLSKRVERTLLVCNDTWSPSQESVRWSFTLDFAKPQDARVHVFAKFLRRYLMFCADGANQIVKEGVTSWKNLSERLEDSDGDGIDDWTITLERAYAPGSPALGKKFEALCRNRPGSQMLEVSAFVGRYQRFTLKFKGDASSLVPTAETAKLLEEWHKQAVPEFRWSIN